VQKQLVIIIIAIGLPLVSIATASCAIGNSIAERISVAGDRIRPKLAIQGGSQLTIRLKPTKQHPTISKSDLAAVQKIIENRTDGLRIAGALVRATGQDTIVVELPQIFDARQAERVLGGTAQLEFRSQKVGTEEKLSAELLKLREAQAEQVRLKNLRALDRRAIATNQVAIEKQYTEIGKLFDRATITGEHLKNAVAQPISGEGWEIEIEFDDLGSTAFANLTKKLAGTGRAIGVFIDKDPISTPTVGAQFVTTGITGGKAVITGNFTPDTAKDLAIQLKSGALPVPIEIIENRTVRPK
jgi:preprotein translocase subunit SecD